MGLRFCCLYIDSFEEGSRGFVRNDCYLGWGMWMLFGLIRVSCVDCNPLFLIRCFSFPSLIIWVDHFYAISWKFIFVCFLNFAYCSIFYENIYTLLPFCCIILFESDDILGF